MITSTTNITGFINWLLTLVKQRDPVNEAINAMDVNNNNLANGIFTFFKKVRAAKKVPVKEGIFNEPMTCATELLFSKIKPAGVCINPPPPTMASTKPAKKAMMQSKIIVTVIGYYSCFKMGFNGVGQVLITIPVIIIIPLIN